MRFFIPKVERTVSTRTPVPVFINGVFYGVCAGWIAAVAVFFFVRNDTAPMEPRALPRVAEITSRAAVTAPVPFAASTSSHRNVDELSAPFFTVDAPVVYQLRPDAPTEISWLPVPQATRYRVILRDNSGHRVRVFSTRVPHLILPEIDKTSDDSFWLSLVSLDASGRESAESDRRRVMFAHP